MKTSIALAAVLAATSVAFAQTGSSVSDLSITGNFAYESEYIFRGLQYQENSFQPSVEFGFPVVGGNLYSGIWTAQPINAKDDAGNNFDNEIDLFAGYAYPVTEMFTADLGLTYYWYPETEFTADGNFASETQEIYFGVTTDVLLSPAIYFYYDFELEAITIEGSLGYSVDLNEYFGIENTSIDLGSSLGFVDAQNDKYFGEGNGYTYWGVTADLIYAFNENVSSSIGGRYAGNNDAGDDAVKKNNDSHLWFGASISFEY